MKPSGPSRPYEDPRSVSAVRGTPARRTHSGRGSSPPDPRHRSAAPGTRSWPDRRRAPVTPDAPLGRRVRRDGVARQGPRPGRGARRRAGKSRRRGRGRTERVRPHRRAPAEGSGPGGGRPGRGRPPATSFTPPAAMTATRPQAARNECSLDVRCACQAALARRRSPWPASARRPGPVRPTPDDAVRSTPHRPYRSRDGGRAGSPAPVSSGRRPLPRATGDRRALPRHRRPITIRPYRTGPGAGGRGSQAQTSRKSASGTCRLHSAGVNGRAAMAHTAP